MKRAVLALLAGAAPTPALAGAWNMASGDAQAIVKLERMRAVEGYDGDGVVLPLAGERIDDLVSVYAEYGLTDRFTLQLKSEWQSGSDQGVDYEGLGPTEIGVRWQAYRNDHVAVALYAGYAAAGEARNAGYAPPGAGQGDWEVRALAGYSGGVPWVFDQGFIEVQAARRFRSGLPDEDRLDLTMGVTHGENWLIMNQVFAGRTLEGAEAYWINTETSIVRHFGDWSVQGGWRQSLAGRWAPAQSGPIIGLWRRF